MFREIAFIVKYILLPEGNFGYKGVTALDYQTVM
jgi:hypothetical protein